MLRYRDSTSQLTAVQTMGARVVVNGFLRQDKTKGERNMSQWHPADLELLRTVSDPAQPLKEATARPPFGPSFDAALAQQADRLEVWGTTEDAPEDYTEFRLVKDGRVIGVARIPGY